MKVKYLSHYIEKKQQDLFAELGAFHAFSEKQFNEQKKNGVKYVSMGNGGICPEINAKKYIKGVIRLTEEAIQDDIAENGKKAIIHRELGNHEYVITYDITDTVNALYNYGINETEVQAETGEYLRRYREWEKRQESEVE